MGISEPRHIESHQKETSSIRDFVFGFGDGINTSLGIVAGVGGADVSSNLIILAAIVAMFTGAKAMAVQNYLAVKSKLANISIIRGGLEMAGLGTGIALIGYGIGSELANIGILKT